MNNYNYNFKENFKENIKFIKTIKLKKDQTVNI